MMSVDRTATVASVVRNFGTGWWNLVVGWFWWWLRVWRQAGQGRAGRREKQEEEGGRDGGEAAAEG